MCVCTEERRGVQGHLNRSSWSDRNSPDGCVDWNWSRFVELQVCPHTTWSVGRAILFPWSRLTITQSSPHYRMKGFKSALTYIAWFPKLWRKIKSATAITYNKVGEGYCSGQYWPQGGGSALPVWYRRTKSTRRGALTAIPDVALYTTWSPHA